jgi:hypothetical protein
MRETRSHDVSITRTRRRPLALAAVALATAGGAIAVALSGGSTLGPAEALAQAAEQTAQVTSGVVHTRIEVAGGPTANVVARFDGDDVDVVYDQPTEDGGLQQKAVRAVDGSAFQRTGDEPWRPVEASPGATVAELRSDIADEELFDAVRGASGVTQDGDILRARVDPALLAGVHNDLLGLGDAPLADDVTVDVEASTDGLIRSIRFAGDGVVRTVTYSELGQPQVIEAPGS